MLPLYRTSSVLFSAEYAQRIVLSSFRLFYLLSSTDSCTLSLSKCILDTFIRGYTHAPHVHMCSKADICRYALCRLSRRCTIWRRSAQFSVVYYWNRSGVDISDRFVNLSTTVEHAVTWGISSFLLTFLMHIRTYKHMRICMYNLELYENPPTHTLCTGVLTNHPPIWYLRTHLSTAILRNPATSHACQTTTY